MTALVLGAFLAFLVAEAAPGSAVFTGPFMWRCRWWLLALGGVIVVCCGAR
jgi:hypothetical protein